MKFRCAHILPLGKQRSLHMLALSPKPGNWVMLQTLGIQNLHWNCQRLLMLSTESSEPWLLIECVLGYKPLKLFKLSCKLDDDGFFPLTKIHSDDLSSIIFLNTCTKGVHIPVLMHVFFFLPNKANCVHLQFDKPHYVCPLTSWALSAMVYGVYTGQFTTALASIVSPRMWCLS